MKFTCIETYKLFGTKDIVQRWIDVIDVMNLDMPPRHSPGIGSGHAPWTQFPVMDTGHRVCKDKIDGW